MKIKWLRLIQMDYYTNSISLVGFLFLFLFGTGFYYERLTFSTIIFIALTLLSFLYVILRMVYLLKFIRSIDENVIKATIEDISISGRKYCLLLSYEVNKEKYQKMVILPKYKEIKNFKKTDALDIIYEPIHKKKIFVIDLLEVTNKGY